MGGCTRAQDASELTLAPPDLNHRDLMMQFESLGGSGHGCEFGLMQRHFGAEPLGLLRWADLSADLLLKALESRFYGVGLADNTIVFNPEHSNEWWTKDSRFWMAMRSFVKTADVTFDKMTEQVCRRLRFLRSKLIEDLEVSEKIFVYKNMFRDLTEEEITRLHAAVRSFGPATLFYVRYADAEHPAGTVEAPASGLLIGYIDHFAFSREDKPLEPAHDGWLTLCSRAYWMHQGLPAETGPGVPDRIGQRPARARRIVLIGNCQMQAMAGLYRRFVAGRTGDTLEHVASYQDLTPEGRAAIERADVVVEQIFDLRQQVDIGEVSKATPRLYIPMVTGAFLWPFAGQPHPKNSAYPFLTGGPYNGEAADAYLNRQIVAGVDPDEAVDTYMNLDVNSRVKLDRLHELVIDRQRSRDEAAGYRMSEVIEAHFKTEQIFLSPYHPNVRVAVALAARFFEQLGARGDEIERMRNCTRITPFPKGELPLHPGVCSHFGIRWVAPEQRYRFMNEGFFTFREYARRYMRYEWNAALEEGLHLLHTGNRAAARAKLTSGLESSPDSAAGWNALSHVLAHTGARANAVAAARRAVAIEPGAASYRANLGNLLREERQFEAAEAELRAAISDDPGEPHHHVLLAHLLRQCGRVKDGVGLLARAIELDPYSVRLLVNRADFAEASGELDTAVAAIKDAIAIAPDTASSHQRLAALLVRQDRSTEAIESARRAVALDPAAARYRINLSNLLLRDGQKAEAVAEAHAAAVAAPDSGQAFGHLGHVLQATEDHAGAEAAFRHAVKLAPGDAHIRHQLSVFLNQRQRFEEGIVAAREAAELEPGNPHRFLHLTRFLVQRNDLAGAVAAQRRAVDLQPETASFRVLLSDLLARDGRLDEALTEARMAVESDPKSAHALGHLAHVVQMTGDFRLGEAMLCDAIVMEPGDDHLRGQLERLRVARQRAAQNGRRPVQ